MFLLITGALVLSVWLAMWGAERLALAAGQRPNAARRWKYGVLVAVLLLIFWDWLPTWIAYQYYSRQAGLQVFKTLDQWKAENPEVAEALEVYGRTHADKRGDMIRLSGNKYRDPLNDRFAHDYWREYPFLSVKIWRHQLVDLKANSVIVDLTTVTAGNSGGVHAGGEGWWKFWLIRDRTSTMKQQQGAFFRFVEEARKISGR
jgi:hypothetical protein